MAEAEQEVVKKLSKYEKEMKRSKEEQQKLVEQVSRMSQAHNVRV